MYQVSLLPR